MQLSESYRTIKKPHLSNSFYLAPTRLPVPFPKTRTVSNSRTLRDGLHLCYCAYYLKFHRRGKWISFALGLALNPINRIDHALDLFHVCREKVIRLGLR